MIDVTFGKYRTIITKKHIIDTVFRNRSSAEHQMHETSFEQNGILGNVVYSNMKITEQSQSMYTLSNR
jgi:hypothetical protein